LPGLIDTVKALKHMRQIFGRNTGSRIPDDQVRLRRTRRSAHFQTHVPSLRCVLEGIIDKIVDHLTQMYAIAGNLDGLG